MTRMLKVRLGGGMLNLAVDRGFNWYTQTLTLLRRNNFVNAYSVQDLKHKPRTFIAKTVFAIKIQKSNI